MSFHQKFQALQSKLQASNINAKFMESFCDLPKTITVDCLPIFLSRLLDVLEAIIDKSIDEKQKTKEKGQDGDEADDLNSSMKFIHNSTIRHPIERKKEESKRTQGMKKKRHNSSLHHKISQLRIDRDLLLFKKKIW